MSQNESHFRSFIKGLSWRITGTVDTILLSFIITQRVDMALKIGAVEVFTKIILYYGHERVWQKIGWGKPKVLPEEAQLAHSVVLPKDLHRAAHEVAAQNGVSLEQLVASAVNEKIAASKPVHVSDAKPESYDRLAVASPSSIP